jgi:hypothetical protein
MGEFAAPKNEFLVFEDGPSVDVHLQWATYRDASDQTSLSRIWGGIHPPVDDIPGRLIGQKIGPAAFRLAEQYFTGGEMTTSKRPVAQRNLNAQAYPNPVAVNGILQLEFAEAHGQMNAEILNMQGQVVGRQVLRPVGNQATLPLPELPGGTYLLRVTGTDWIATQKIVITGKD